MSVSDESLNEVDSISKEGWLWKTGSNNKGWRERYFVLANGKLSYYKSDKADAAVQGSVDLAECDHIAQSAGRKGFGFDIFVPGRVYNISADTHQVQQDWMTAINTSLALIKSLPVDASRSRVASAASIRSSSGGFMKRRSRKDSTNSADRKEDTVLVHSLLEAEVDALHSKMANMEDSLQSSQSNCSQLQEELRLCKQQHSLEINVIKDEVESLSNQVKSLQQAKYQLETMNDSYKEQLHERDDDIEGLREELKALEDESLTTQHMLEEAQQKTNALYTQTLQDGETVSSLQGELDAMREQSLRLEEKVEKLNQELSVAMETATSSNAELLSVRSQLEEAEEKNAQLTKEIERVTERTRQLQLEKDKAMSDLIALKKSQKNRERKLSSEGEEGKLSAHRVTRHSPAPERTVSEHVLAEAEKRAELATRLLQEVQAERDSLKAQLGKHSPSSPRQPNGDRRVSPDNIRRLSPARLLSKSPPTTASSAADVPPRKPQRPPDNLLGMYRSEFT